MSVLKRATPTVTRGICLLWSSPKTRDIHTYCRVFGSEAVTICLNDLGMSRLGFEHPTFRLRYQRSNPLRHDAIVNNLNAPDQTRNYETNLSKISI